MKIIDVKSFNKKGKSYLAFTLEGLNKPVYLSEKQVTVQTGLSKNFYLLKGSDLSVEYYKTGEYLKNNNKVKEDNKLIKYFSFTLSEKSQNIKDQLIDSEVANKKKGKTKENDQKTKLNPVSGDNTTQQREKTEFESTSKQAFISSLIPHLKYADNNLQEKYLDLVSEEMGNLSDMEDRIMKELHEIKESFNDRSISTKDNQKQIIKDENSYKEKNKRRINLNEHDPKATAKFLNAFAANPILKYTTHNFDEEKSETATDIKKEFNLDNYRDLIEREFKAISKFNIPRSLYAKFGKFLFDPFDNEKQEGWSKYSIKMGWGAKSLNDWCSKNPGKWPNPGSNMGYDGFYFEKPMEFKFKDGSKSFKASKFVDIIDEFKKQIQFRSDLNNDLFSVIYKINLNYRKDVSFINKIPKHIDFYTDVEKFLQAYKNLISGIIQFHNQDSMPEVKIRAKEKENKIILEVIHSGQVFPKTFNSFKERIESNSGDYFADIRNKLFSLCDWEMEAKFAGEVPIIRYIILGADFYNYFKTEEEFHEGIKHIFTFYRANTL